MWELLLKNDFITGGLFLSILGIIWTYCKSLPRFLYRQAKRYLFPTIEISSEDDGFYKIDMWITEHYNGKNINKLLYNVYNTPYPDGNNKSNFSLVPGFGFHWFKYKSFWLLFYKWRTTGSVTSKPIDNYQILILSTSSNVVQNLLQDINEYHNRLLQSKIEVFTHEPYGDIKNNFLTKRSWDSIYLNDNLKTFLLNDVINFQNKRSFYNDIGIRYKRGYLLEGPPGNGKTSIIHALASHLDYKVISISLSILDDSGLVRLFSWIAGQEKIIVLIEDIDSIFNGRTNTVPGSKLTFTNFINCIDGLNASNGHLLFMTTNKIQTFDPALIRPGRVDVNLHIAKPDKNSIDQIISKLYPDLPEDQRNILYSSDYSMSEVQEFLLSAINKKELHENKS